jgi:hypothetical protein
MTGFVQGKEVHFDDKYLHVLLTDRRIISTPMDWYPPLQNATLTQLRSYRFICGNTGIEWEALDYHLSIESMLARSQEAAA